MRTLDIYVLSAKTKFTGYRGRVDIFESIIMNNHLKIFNEKNDLVCIVHLQNATDFIVFLTFPSG